MRKKFWLKAFLLCTLPYIVWSQTSTLTISGSSPSPMYYSNDGTRVWITGTFTVTRANKYVDPSFTVDLAPPYGSTIYSERNNWIFDSDPPSIVYIDGTDTYKQQITGQTYAIKQLGMDSNITNNNVWSYTFGSKELSKTFTYYVSFRHSEFLDAGTYQFADTFRVWPDTLGDINTSTMNFVSSLSVNFIMIVASEVFIIFMSNNSVVTELAFDEITAPIPQDFTIIIRSNFRYYLRVQSALGHGGFLHHEKYSDPYYPITETIPYTLTVAGTTIPLASGSYTIASRVSATWPGQAPKTYAASIAIGDVTNYSAGKYTDILRFTISSW